MWPGPELPRTEGTRKLKRRELRNWLVGQQPPAEPPQAPAAKSAAHRSAGEVLARFAPGRTIEPATTIDELGLSSLERVELMMALEEAFQTTIDEDGVHRRRRRSRDLEALVAPPDWGQTGVRPRVRPAVRPASDPGLTAGTRARRRRSCFPSWNRTLPVRVIRRASLPTWILPLGRDLRARHGDGTRAPRAPASGPVIFASNHQSHFDTPVILDSLPPRWRYRVAPAMMKEFFNAHFFPERHTAGRRGSPTA